MVSLFFSIGQVAYVKYICHIYVYTDIYKRYESVLGATGTAMQQLPSLLAKQPAVWGASPIGVGLQPCRDG